MNCLRFQSMVHEIAWETPMDPRTWDAALTHAASCVDCARLLNDTRSLAAALRAMAQAADKEQGPLALEMRLIEAFRKEQKVQPIFRVFRQRGRRVAAAMAAAVVLVALGLAVLHRRGARQPYDIGSSAPSRHGNSSAAQNVSAAPAAESRSDTAQAVSRSPSTRRKARGRRPAAASRGTIFDTTELAADFLPLPGAEGARDLDSGELVRVELPRSALVYLGLPVTGDSGGQNVTADVLIGEDGLAQAVRFVQ